MLWLVMDALENGDVHTVMDNLTLPVLQSIVNIIGNVLNNPTFKITKKQKRRLIPYKTTYAFLLDKKQPPEAKKHVLQQKGEAFLPTFLDIVGDEISLFTTRIRKSCPVCGKEDLIKLSNHLKQQHNITGEKRKQMLRNSSHIAHATDDQGDEDSDGGNT